MERESSDDEGEESGAGSSSKENKGKEQGEQRTT